MNSISKSVDLSCIYFDEMKLSWPKAIKLSVTEAASQRYTWPITFWRQSLSGKVYPTSLKVVNLLRVTVFWGKESSGRGTERKEGKGGMEDLKASRFPNSSLSFGPYWAQRLGEMRAENKNQNLQQSWKDGGKIRDFLYHQPAILIPNTSKLKFY